MHLALTKSCLQLSKEGSLNVWPCSGPSKTIMQGIVNGSRIRDGQRKRREVNIKESTDLSVSELLRASKDQKGLREVIRRYAMAPLRPPEVMA